jgi:hypothetical protein
VYEDISGSKTLLWMQWWRSERHLEAYLGSTDFRSLLGAIKVLGTLESARVIDLQDATSVMGAFLADRTAVSGLSRRHEGENSARLVPTDSTKEFDRA